jgi:chemotaxis protein MotB
LKTRNSELEDAHQRNTIEIGNLRKAVSDHEKALALEQSSAKSLKTRNAELEQSNRKATTDITNLKAALAQKEKVLAEKESALALEQKSLKASKAKSEDLDRAQQKLLAELSSLRAALAAKEKALALELNTSKASKARGEDLDRAQQKLLAELVTLKATLAQKDKALGEKEKALALEQSSSKASKTRGDQLDQTQQKLLAELATLKAALAEREKALALEQSSSKAAKTRGNQLDKTQQQLLAEVASLRILLAQQETALAEKEQALVLLNREKEVSTAELANSRTRAETASLELVTLAAQIDELNRKLAILAADLSSAKSTLIDKDKKITDLDEKLKQAMVQKVEELADYRSEFFGKLKRALSNRPEIRVVGDRFVFQSEVLFPSASAELEEGGKQELVTIADTLKEMSKSIPKEVNWILTVVGHTDKRPISTPLFRSNWELSAARAISVVKFLVEAGIPPERLAATGYGEYQPIDDGQTDEALAKNRRIELKFNQK